MDDNAESKLYLKSTWEWDPFLEPRTIPKGWDLSELYQPHEGDLDTLLLPKKEE